MGELFEIDIFAEDYKGCAFAYDILRALGIKNENFALITAYDDWCFSGERPIGEWDALEAHILRGGIAEVGFPGADNANCGMFVSREGEMYRYGMWCDLSDREFLYGDYVNAANSEWYGSLYASLDKALENRYAMIAAGYEMSIDEYRSPEETVKNSKNAVTWMIKAAYDGAVNKPLSDLGYTRRLKTGAAENVYIYTSMSYR